MKLFMELSPASRCLHCFGCMCLSRPAPVNPLVVLNGALIVQVK